MFDGDAAGQAAAMKAFEGEQKLAGQTFVAVAPEGMDPCDLRQKSGDAAVRDLVARRTPLFEFVIRSRARRARPRHRRGPGRGAAPLRADGRAGSRKRRCATSTPASLPAGWAGTTSPRSRRGCARRRKAGGATRVAACAAREAAAAATSRAPPCRRRDPVPRDPTLWPQREALKAALQYPAIAGPVFDSLPVESFTHPTYVAVRAAIASRWHVGGGLGGAQWIDAVREQVAVAGGGEPGHELGVEAVRSTKRTACRATSRACWPGCRRCGWAGRSPR